MTPEHLLTVLKQANAKSEPGDKTGWDVLPEGTTLTLYVAHAGVNLNVNRVEGLRQEGELLYARTAKKDMFCVARADVFAVGIEGNVSGVPARRAGFG